MKKQTWYNIGENFIRFVKREVVLFCAWILAIISMFFVPPDWEYATYIDVRTLALLWSLMVIIQGLKTYGVFQRLGDFFVSKSKKIWQMCAALIFICFFSSMLITNDVALMTFVPLAIMLLKRLQRETLIVPVVVLQTIAANLGSMLTPIGNPQNLYLYGISGMSLGAFVQIMLPYTCLAALLLIFAISFLPAKREEIVVAIEEESCAMDRKKIALYTALFVVALLVVLRVLPFWVVAMSVFVVVGIVDRKSILTVDYCLLLTFVGFFVFSGNMSRLPAIHTLLSNLVAGHELLSGVILSQGISNVPAALLLAGFSDDLTSLLLGVNFGGLGTLIASMASLISYKILAREDAYMKKRFLVIFTMQNILFLAVLLLAWRLLQ